jgi:hypothetical protein
MSVIAFPATRKMAYALARWFRTSGFYLPPSRTWICVADLVEYLAEFEPTSSQPIFLWSAHQIFLDLSQVRQ